MLQEQPAVLSSWKDIANYTGKGVRTVQRWERYLGLPVRRLNGGNARKGAVLLYRADADEWMKTRFPLRSEVNSANKVCGTLQQGIRTTGELRTTTRLLAAKIESDVAFLAEARDPLTILHVEVSWCITVLDEEQGAPIARTLAIA